MQAAMLAAAGTSSIPSTDSSTQPLGRTVLVRTGAYIGAIPLRDVVEIVRPLRVQRLASAPSYVRGVAIVRGLPVPVVDLPALLGEPPSRDGRWVILRSADRLVALSVDAMLGLKELPAEALSEVPPLLRQARAETFSSLAALDGDLLVTLDAARAVPPEVWQTLQAEAAE